MFVCCGFGRFFRVVDQLDIWREVESLEEMGEGDELATAKAWRADIPEYMGEKIKPLGDRTFRQILKSLPPRGRMAKAMTLAEQIAATARPLGRVEFDEYDQDELNNLGEPYPILSLHFHDADPIRAMVDDCMNLAMQTSAIPNVVIP